MLCFSFFSPPFPCTHRRLRDWMPLRSRLVTAPLGFYFGNSPRSKDNDFTIVERAAIRCSAFTWNFCGNLPSFFFWSAYMLVEGGKRGCKGMEEMLFMWFFISLQSFAAPPHSNCRPFLPRPAMSIRSTMITQGSPCGKSLSFSITSQLQIV